MCRLVVECGCDAVCVALAEGAPPEAGVESVSVCGGAEDGWDELAVAMVLAIWRLGAGVCGLVGSGRE
jgi:hypothetical protein